MTDFVFNAVKGKFRYYTQLPASNDALIHVLVKASGLEAAGTMKDYTDLASLLAGTTDECDFTNYARLVVTTPPTETVDNTNDWVDIKLAADPSWVNAGGATNNSTGMIITCYDPDTTTGTDSSLIPLCAYGYTETTTGSTITATQPAAGFLRAT